MGGSYLSLPWNAQGMNLVSSISTICKKAHEQLCSLAISPWLQIACETITTVRLLLATDHHCATGHTCPFAKVQRDSQTADLNMWLCGTVTACQLANRKICCCGSGQVAITKMMGHRYLYMPFRHRVLYAACECELLHTSLYARVVETRAGPNVTKAKRHACKRGPQRWRLNISFNYF